MATSEQINRLIANATEKDHFDIQKFDHLEWFVGDAYNSAQVFKLGLGMKIVGHSRHETGNHTYCSYVLETGVIRWVLTSPYNSEFVHPTNKQPHPGFKGEIASKFLSKHGSGVSAIGIEVEDARVAFEESVKRGATGVLEPVELSDDAGTVVMAEVNLVGDVVMRFVEKKDYTGVYIPGYERYEDTTPLDYKIYRMDHCVSNVYDMDAQIENMKTWFGFHTFAKFSEEDIRTEYTSLNSEVLSNNYETVLLPVNEPAPGKKESQITEYLKANNGPGVQHIALFTSEVLETIKLMRESPVGFEFIPTPPTYYDDEKVQKIMKEHLTEEACALAKEYGLLVDEDGEGVLLQIFTKPLFDRPTIFVEIIQRLCKGEIVDKPGCGGFGKGNFRALFQSIERLQAEREMLLDQE